MWHFGVMSGVLGVISGGTAHYLIENREELIESWNSDIVCAVSKPLYIPQGYLFSMLQQGTPLEGDVLI